LKISGWPQRNPRSSASRQNSNSIVNHNLQLSTNRLNQSITANWSGSKKSWHVGMRAHPGVPEREQARIGLILALEFGQLLLMKFTNWKAKAYLCFK
jgi:hypothetical protein